MSVPIYTSPGRSGFGPQLSLTYDSGAGNGPFGFGWSLGLPAIARKTDKGLPRYRDEVESDVFILSGSEDLVPVYRQDPDGTWVADHPGHSRDPDGFWVRDPAGRLVVHEDAIDGYRIRRYRPRIEGLFARIERWTRQKDRDVHWRSISKDNILTIYGLDANSRIADPVDSGARNRVFSWLISETRDDKGNAIVYEYKAEDGAGVDLTCPHQRNRGPANDSRRTATRYLKRIRYGNRVSLLLLDERGQERGQRPYFLTDLRDSACWPRPPGEASGGPDWMFEVVFDYGEHDLKVPRPDDAGEWGYRDDPFSSFRSGFEVRTCRLCQRVLMFHHFEGEEGVGRDCLVRSTNFTYCHEADAAKARKPVYSFLLSVTQTGHRRDGDGYVSRSLPPLEFDYSQPIVQDTVHEVNPESLENLPIGLDGSLYSWTDLHGEGIPGILTEQGGAWFYKRNLSPLTTGDNDSESTEVRFAPVELVAVKPNMAIAGGAQFMDLAGDGQPDLVVFDGPTPGLYEHDNEEGWQPFRPFVSRLNRDTREANLKFLDLDGDGHVDVLITEDDALVWHPSIAEDGFGAGRRVPQAFDEEQGPRLVFADRTQSIYLADMSGDGLTDLLRIRNGEVCYWPNLGYGRFGARITMDQSPWFDHSDQFEQKRIRLADIDGTGPADIIYLHADGVRLYFNQSGNGWSEPQVLRAFPPVDDLTNIVPTDLLGNGTTCLVWSSRLSSDGGRQMRYVDLMGGHKPHLLVKTVNNLGAETHVHYVTSSRFYLQDKRDGTPWVTRLPFPVQVVERVETYDYISRNRFVTSYTYHHGYFDGEEREFRGFGRVEQVDTEEFGAFSQGGDFPMAENVDQSSHAPPVLTKTWFHTGAYYRGRDISKHLEQEYYREGDESLGERGLSDEQLDAMLLEDTVLPATLSPDGAREASRALKGSILRVEVYALDDTEESDRPYTVSERSYQVRETQPRGENRHAVFFVQPRETIEFHYERKLYDIAGERRADPRVTHNLTLAVDGYGDVLMSAAIGYGRRIPDPAQELTEADHKKQERILLTYTENSYTNPILEAADYRTPLPCESRFYELVNLLPDSTVLGVTNLFWFDELRSKIDIARDLNYEDVDHLGAVGEGPWRRLIECVRTVYRKDDLTALLLACEAQPLALPGETYSLAFTPGLLAQVYQRTGVPLLPDPANVLGGTGQDRGGYMDLDGDGCWWIPAGKVFYHPDADIADPAATAAQELAEARQHFFLPRKFADAFGQCTTVDYGAPHDLLIADTRDALGNLVQAVNDYRILQPKEVTDPNANSTEVAYDSLGMLVGTAVKGKVAVDGKTESGDSLEGFTPDITETDLDLFFTSPKTKGAALLGTATTRIIYDVTCYWRTNDPNRPTYTSTLAREKHVVDLAEGETSPFQVSFSYSDGLGREIQKKIQAEPGSLVDNGPIASPRWVGSGWTIFNNKGKPVRKYEPFFSPTHCFEFGKREGFSSTLFYDPVERVVATLHANNTYEKVVFDPWRQGTWDVNDTVLRDPRTDSDIHGYAGRYFAGLPSSLPWLTWYAQRADGAAGLHEQVAAKKAADHADTPTMAYFDTLGRPFLTVAHNRVVCPDHDLDGTEDRFATRVELDIEGNQSAVRDAVVQNGDRLGRIVMRYDHSIAGPGHDEDVTANRIHQANMDSGERWTLNDVTGKPLRAWDTRGFMRRMTYDCLRRPTGLYVTENGFERLAERTEYGEGLDKAGNHRTRVWRVSDAAGIVTNLLYDFKGNLLESRRELLPDYQHAVDWSLDPKATDGSFASSTTYDALNRPITQTTPHTPDMPPSVVHRCYNDAGLLESVDVSLRGAQEWTPFVRSIDYNAKGQRTGIVYGNRATTTYTYDEKTFRLRILITTRPERDDFAWQIFASPTVVQDLRYTYDPVGNITCIEDAALKTVCYRDEEVQPASGYTYDAIYRLIEAKGREHIGQCGFRFDSEAEYRDYPCVGAAHPNDLNAFRKYTQRYTYDAVGNLTFMRHFANGGSWTREYAYDADSLIESGKKNNALTQSHVGNGLDRAETYNHDSHGNMIVMPHLASMEWDFEDQLQRVGLGGGGRAYYLYDAAGHRVRKVIATESGTRQKERFYLDGLEIYRQYNGNNKPRLERESLHLMDGQERIALVETQTAGDGEAIQEPVVRQRYQFGDHLGSSRVELGDDGILISWEEYHPYGTTACQAVSAIEASIKRYRYTGKERDEESALYYHGARYLAPWLARWTSSDPLPLDVSLSPFVYARASPVTAYDPTGLQEEWAVWRWMKQKVTAAARSRLVDALVKGVVPWVETGTFPQRLPAEESPHITVIGAQSPTRTPASGPPPGGWSPPRPRALGCSPPKPPALPLPESRSTLELVNRDAIARSLKEFASKEHALEAERTIEQKIASYRHEATKATRGARAIAKQVALEGRGLVLVKAGVRGLALGLLSYEMEKGVKDLLFAGTGLDPERRLAYGDVFRMTSRDWQKLEEGRRADERAQFVIATGGYLRGVFINRLPTPIRNALVERLLKQERTTQESGQAPRLSFQSY